MFLASLPRTSITVAKTKRHILHDLMCDKLVRAVRFRTPPWQIRTLERGPAFGRIVRIQFADGRLNRPMSLNRMSEVRSGVFLDSVGPDRWSGQSGKELVLGAPILHPEPGRPGLLLHRSHIIEESHETEVHMQLLMTVQ